MSYCRWSSDNWKSDVYVYASDVDRYHIHVAANRTVGDAPEVPDIRTADLTEYSVAHEVQMKWLENAERKPIELPHAGDSFCEESPHDAAYRLKALQELGYHVPQFAIDRLLEEAEL